MKRIADIYYYNNNYHWKRRPWRPPRCVGLEGWKPARRRKSPNIVTSHLAAATHTLPVQPFDRPRGLTKTSFWNLSPPCLGGSGRGGVDVLIRSRRGKGRKQNTLMHQFLGVYAILASSTRSRISFHCGGPGETGAQNSPLRIDMTRPWPKGGMRKILNHVAAKITSRFSRPRALQS